DRSETITALPTALPAPRLAAGTVARWARRAAGVVILAVLAYRLGGGPFLAALRSVDGWAVVAAVAVTAATTACCAWRWQLISAVLGIRLRPGQAVAAYYGSQFLNVTLPAG